MVPDISNDLVGSLSTRVVKTPGNAGHSDFKEVMDKQNQVRFSAHAVKRLNQRDIRLSPLDLDRIDQAAGRAADKGAADSLFLLGDLGLIVNVQNRTVLTAIAQDDLKEGIFTNIDSTVIIPTE